LPRTGGRGWQCRYRLGRRYPWGSQPSLEVRFDTRTSSRLSSLFVTGLRMGLSVSPLGPFGEDEIAYVPCKRRLLAAFAISLILTSGRKCRSSLLASAVPNYAHW